jgi:allantoinase
MIKLCDEFNCHTHIVHVSSANALQQIADAKHRGLPLTAETCQHYLYFNAEDITDGKTEFKCAPPIREKENNEQLWQALKNGVLDFVATDHSPAPPAMKELQSGDFMKAWGGIASLQYSLSALWTAAKQHSFNIIDIAKWLSENPALLPALQTKGKIEKGYDADFVVWQPEEKFIADAAVCHHRHKVSPYFGETFLEV